MGGEVEIVNKLTAPIEAAKKAANLNSMLSGQNIANYAHVATQILDVFSISSLLFMQPEASLPSAGISALIRASAISTGTSTAIKLSALTNERGAINGTMGEKTGTIWNSIKATQPAYPGTILPRSFEMTTSSGKFWVHPNATEHIYEYAQGNLNRGVSQDLVNIGIQTQVKSLNVAVDTAARNGVKYGELMNVGGWELKFSAPREVNQLPALIHARPIQ